MYCTENCRSIKTDRNNTDVEQLALIADPVFTRHLILVGCTISRVLQLLIPGARISGDSTGNKLSLRVIWGITHNGCCIRPREASSKTDPCTALESTVVALMVFF